jgi:anaerobic selenocysteine-containing dehydrogenase
MIYLYMQFNIKYIIMTSKKLSAYADSKIRVERGSGYPPIVASIPTEDAEKSGIRLGDDIHILTDREKIVIRKNEVQKSNFRK